MRKIKFTFWNVFFGVIIIGVVIYVVLKAMFYHNVRHSTLKDIKEVQQKLIKISPVFKILSSLDKETKREIKDIIHKEINLLYRPVYKRVDEYVGFHYSLRGDYQELFAGVENRLGDYLQNRIFGSDFKDRLKNRIEIINKKILKLLINKSEKFKKELKKKGYSDYETNILVNEILHYSIEDTKKRYLNITDNLFRVGGVGSAMAAGALISMKVLTKQSAKLLAKKILAKVAVKTSTKLAASAAGAASGAAEGSFLGPVGVGLGAVVGGVVGWFATDYIVIKADEFLHKEEFKKEIIKMINEHKKELENNLIRLYISISNKIFFENKKRLEEFKNKKIKDIIITK